MHWTLAGIPILAALAAPLVWPQGEIAASLAKQVQADVVSLSSEPTLASWLGSHRGSKVDLAHYDIQKDPYDVDFARINRWCAASVDHAPAPVLRAALFYVPSVKPGALPVLSEDSHVETRSCQMQAMWYETREGVSIDAVVRELSAVWGKPTGPTTGSDIGGSAMWTPVYGWHWRAINIWVAYDPHGKPGGVVGPRLIVYARRDIERDTDAALQLLGVKARNAIVDAAARIAQQDPDLTKAVTNRSRCYEAPLGPEAESLTVSRLAEWIHASSGSPRERKAASLLVADAYVACAQGLPEPLTRLGARFITTCPQDGPSYSHNLRVQAEKLAAPGPAAELVALAGLSQPCSLPGKRPWPDLVIEKGERLFNELPPDQWMPWIHFVAARAHAAKLSFAFPGGEPENGIAPLTEFAMLRERKAAINHFKSFLQVEQNAAESVFAWRETWRLLAGLPPSQIHFACSCE